MVITLDNVEIDEKHFEFLSLGTKGGSSSIMHNVISSGGVGIGKLSVSSSSLKVFLDSY